jgi:hypothetical protein
MPFRKVTQHARAACKYYLGPPCLIHALLHVKKKERKFGVDEATSSNDGCAVRGRVLMTRYNQTVARLISDNHAFTILIRKITVFRQLPPTIVLHPAVPSYCRRCSHHIYAAASSLVQSAVQSFLCVNLRSASTELAGTARDALPDLHPTGEIKVAGASEVAFIPPTGVGGVCL